MQQTGWRRLVKMTVDKAIAGVGVVALAPLYVAVSAGILATMGRPVLFRQKRPGYKGRIFEVMKFRTMTEERDAQGNLLPDEQRLHGFGRFLRRTSLDELPQLFNVLRGELSLVGPRPLLVRYLSRYTPEQMRRHDVLPGITGWAQVHGRNAISWEEKFAYDVWYVDHWSLALDVEVLARTVAVVLGREGIDGNGAAVSSSEFMGSAGAATS